MNKFVNWHIIKSIIFSAVIFSSIVAGANPVKSDVVSQENSLFEIKLKFAFVSKFIEYVDNDWLHAFEDNKIIIDVFGDISPEEQVILQNFKQKKIKNFPLIVRINPKIRELKNSDIIFVTKGAKFNISYLLKYSRDSVLTIGDNKYFIDQGGIIEFYDYRGKIRFDIDEEKARKKGIFFNAKLLELSEVNR
ncbi:MAG: YfiR family protein [Rickettsiales bacterium]